MGWPKIENIMVHNLFVMSETLDWMDICKCMIRFDIFKNELGRTQLCPTRPLEAILGQGVHWHPWFGRRLNGN